MSCSFCYKLWRRLKGILLSPLYLVMAHIAGVPGIGFHLRCVATGTNLLFTGRASLKTCYNYLFSPMVSTRYFEFHEVWKSVKGLAFTRYLDVSSPRLMPLFLLKAAPGATAELINPDSSDLRETEKLAIALGLKSRCEVFNGILDKAGFTPASFDLITCISVLEHIPEDKLMVESMWSLLRPGGKLILTFPCMAQPLEQYISHNPYGVLNPGDDGYTFWQRYYDRERMESTIYSITDKPSYIAVYGEKKCGFFFRNASMKWLLGPFYPFWREPYMMATEYHWFSSTDELPGEGVAMLEFIKPGEES
ncbi:MAG: class I SAM-dependent methyltransferase [Thermodesulfobacteriota bacterium]